MKAPTFDLGLGEADIAAMKAARGHAFALDREAALRLIAEASSLVDAAVRRRPLFSGRAFELPGHEEESRRPGPDD